MARVNQTDINKRAVMRFNMDVIGKGDAAAFAELFDPDFVNRTAPPGMPPGKDGMWNTIVNVLRPAFPDLTVEILDQFAEGDRVCTRKIIRGTHKGALMGIAPTGKAVAIDVIDIVRLRDGRYLEHWGMNSLAAVVAQLKAG
ncbi:MAG: ester cyclase [Alphaproteobacteria bacterium]|nr:ester cyclase [Alphaproteobacteria bacterium]